MDAAARTTAQRRFRIFWIMNAAAIAFLLEDILVLYGIRNGLPEPALAALASFVQLTMPFMILGRVFSARRGLVGGWITAYSIRYPAVLVLIAAPFFADQAARTAIILAGGFVFAALRAAGMINAHPLNGEITTEQDRGRYLHGNFALFNLTYMIAVGLTITATRIFDSILVFQVMVGVGAAIGLSSLLVLRGVQESGEGRESARQPFLPLFREVRREVRLGVLIPAWAGGLMSFVLVAPFAMLLIKNGYGVADSTALFFTLLSLLGGVISGLINQRLTERVRPHVLVVTYTIVLICVAAAWSFAPERFVLPLVAGLFVGVGIARAGIIVSLQHFLISENRPEHRMHVSLIAELAAAAMAGLAGTVVGGGLIGYFRENATGMDVFRGYFRVVVAVLLVALFFVLRMRKSRRVQYADEGSGTVS